MAELGLRYPPRNTVDEAEHAARIALLAEDCADLNPNWLDMAAREWARKEPFLPRACELRDSALAIGRMLHPRPALPAPLVTVISKPKLVAPPLTDDEIRRLPQALVDMGVKLGEIEPDRAERLRQKDAA